jgi:hypothetical protein
MRREPFGVVTIACTALFLAQAAVIAAGEADRPLERYLFYVTPLFFTAFFAYVERGAPGRRAYVLLTAAGAVALSLVSFPALTGTAGFFFDSVTLTGFARVAYYTGLTNASLIYALAPIAFGALALIVRRAPHVVAGVAIATALATGAGVYATDRLATGFSATKFAASPPDWLDRSGLGPATYLVLPQSDYFIGTSLESWNRDLRHVAVLATQPPDPFPTSVARIARDGRLELGDAQARTVIVNVAGSSIGLDGRVVSRPRPGLVAYRLVPGKDHVHWLAKGLAQDGWTGTTLRYQAWPIRPGRYELTLSLPDGTAPRHVKIGDRTLTIAPGTPQKVTVPTRGEPLRMRISVPDAPLGGRVLGVKVLALHFAPA